MTPQILLELKAKKSTNTQKEVKTFKLGELFCGPGGIALGALASSLETDDTIFKFEHAWANDYDNDTCKTYAYNICNNDCSSVHCIDVRDLKVNKLSHIDGFAYGFPCNDFSIVGEQKGFKGKFGPLYSYGINIIDCFKPKFFVAENVGGISSANEGKAFKRILEDLTDAGDGYELTSHLYKSEEYEVPQTRHRMIIVGIEKKLGLKFKVPMPTTRENHRTAGEVLNNPPILLNAHNNELTKQSKIVVERLKKIKPGENVWNADLPDHLRLNVKSAKLSQIYKRLDPDKPSYTITGSGGGGTHGYHWKEPRALTNRERARIQTFPDNFVFLGSKESARKQVGMAVPPLLAQHVFNAILKVLSGIEYPFIEENWKG